MAAWANTLPKVGQEKQESNPGTQAPSTLYSQTTSLYASVDSGPWTESSKVSSLDSSSTLSRSFAFIAYSQDPRTFL